MSRYTHDAYEEVVIATKVKCPRCKNLIDAERDELGIITCPECSARLRTKAPVKMKVQSPDPPSVGRTERVMARVDGPDLNATLRPVGQPPLKILRPGAAAPGPDRDDPVAPLRPGAPAPRVQRPGGSTAIDVILGEIRTIRRTQEEILELLRGPGVSAGSASGAPNPPPVARSRGRHVLLVDDDTDTAAAARSALEAGSIDVKSVRDGNECLAAIAMRKPDVIVLETDLGMPMPGKDVVNMIKATMEWVDIPIVIFTRTDPGSEADALRDYSADVLVRKTQGAELELVQRVGALLAQS